MEKPTTASNTLNRYPSKQVMSVVKDDETLLISGVKSKKGRSLAVYRDREICIANA